jgi:tartrate dehydratase alpha subunit/fumarate hydratase class I-like protein
MAIGLMTANHPTGRCPALMIGRAIPRAVVVALMLASAAGAQTLSDPKPKPKWSQPSNTAKPHSAAHVKSCAAFGAGFAQIPGSDACVKIGGFVESTVSGRH